MKIFVIAGNWNEFEYYTRDKMLNSTSYVYVANSDALRGHQDIHGVFIGSWRERKDIVEILDALITRTTNTDVIKDLYKQVKVISSPISVTYKPYNTSRTIKELQDEIAYVIAEYTERN